MPALVREGRIDAFLLRPVPLLSQVMLNTFNVNVVGDLCVAAVLFTVGLRGVGVSWTPARIGFTVAAIVGAALLEAAIQLAISALSFRQADTYTLSIWVDEVMASFGNYPTGIFPVALRALFLTVIPLAYVAYLPASVILGKSVGASAVHVVAYLSPLVGVVAFVCARRFWYGAVKRYQGDGG